MNIPEILTALVSQLKNSSSVSSVGDTNILLGKRSNITEYPVIVIEPGLSRKLNDTFPEETWSLRVNVAAGIHHFDESKQIVGDSNIDGIMDLENDVRKALSEDYTLGGKCLNLSILESSPDDGSDFPIRGFLMVIEILFKQNRTTRA